jgi:hypothetical protein
MVDPTNPDQTRRQRITITLIAIAIIMLLAALLGVLVILNADRMFRENQGSGIPVPQAVTLSLDV